MGSKCFKSHQGEGLFKSALTVIPVVRSEDHEDPRLYEKITQKI